MLRIRFEVNCDDYSPINWPVEHPYWWSCYSLDMSHSIIVSYANDTDYIFKNWPEAKNLEIESVEYYIFTDQFPRPDWF